MASHAPFTVLTCVPALEVPTGDAAKVRASMVVTVGEVGAAVKTVAWNSRPRGPLIMPISISFQEGSDAPCGRNKIRARSWLIQRFVLSASGE